jgi:hypothetical protein
MSEFSMRSALGRTLTIIRQSLGSVGVLIIGVQLVMTAIQFGLVRPVMTAAMTNPGDPTALFESPAYWLAMVGGFLLFSFLLAGSTHGYLATAEGEAVDLAGCARAGLAKALPVLGLCVLWGLAVGIGMSLLLVPGLILLCMWSVSMPALVAGDEGVIGSFGRSRALTKGSRWKILGLLVLFLIVYYVFYSLLLGSVIAANIGNPAGAMAASMLPMTMAGSMVVTTILLFILPALLVSIYVETVRGRIGVRGETVGEVFA